MGNSSEPDGAVICEIIKKTLPPENKLIGAEIGVRQGKSSEWFLTHLPNLTLLYSVDTWKDYPEFDAKWSVEEYAAWYAEAQSRLEKFGDRSIIMRDFSTEAARKVSDGTLDFIFIDGNHLKEFVLRDLEAWYPKMKPSSIMSGHDYDRGSVKAAVAWFFNGLDDIEERHGVYWFKEI